jgi:Plasmid stabilisation system protein.
MAKINWTKKADLLFDKYVFDAYLEYGQKTSQKWLKERIAFADRVAKHPESYTPESLLAERKRLYRSCHIMRRFKIIYYYAPSSDTVHIVDIWDSRMNPETLKQRIK